MSVLDKLRTSLADRYRIERQIGVGGMATVYLARDLKHDREVALKVLRADLSAVIGTERFLSEVRIAAKLDHPHILTLIDSGSADGILYYVLPYVRGESLRAKLDREKQLEVQDALSIITQVASALDYAHGQGVVHRDIKPENILLHQGEAVLADFGIALAVKEGGGDRLTETGVPLGTPKYMSPEQAMGDHGVDRRSDVYSLAAVFYEMMAGEPPVTGPSAQAIIAKLLTQTPIKLRVVRETIPLAMEQATAKALAKTPADRFGSAGEFARALSVGARERQGPLSASRIKMIAIAVSGVAAIGASLWLTRGEADPLAPSIVTLGDRTQITNDGRVRLPDISDDGRMIAYVVADCGTGGCRYGIEMKDIAGGSSRRLLDGATALYGLEVSPDKRNVLFLGSVKGVFSWFLVSTLGGPARQLGTNGLAAFWAGGDSLLLVRGSVPSAVSWILVSGLDGVPIDSIRVAGPTGAITRLASVPNSRRLVYALTIDRTTEWISSDRSGKRYSSIRFSQGVDSPWGAASSDALFISTVSRMTNQGAVVRIPFDARTGHLAERGDTVYMGKPTAISVTADGSALVFEDQTVQHDFYALSFVDLVTGRFSEDKRFMRLTSNFILSLSPDGSAMLLGRDISSEDGTSQLSVMPYGGGAETTVPGRHHDAWFVDSTTLGIRDVKASGVQLSLLDYRTRRRSGVLSIPDSSITSPARIHGLGWAWIPLGGRTINVQRDGEPRPKRIQIPPWYARIFRMRTSQEGRIIAFAGINASGDSIGIGVLSLADGRFTQLWTTFAEYADLFWLQDASLMIRIFDTMETSTFYRTRIGGRVQRIGSSARPVATFLVSEDMNRVLAVTSDYRGDAWMSNVVR